MVGQKPRIGELGGFSPIADRSLQVTNKQQADRKFSYTSLNVGGIHKSPLHLEGMRQT